MKSTIAPLKMIGEAILMAIRLKKVKTEEWLEHNNIDEDRAYYEISKIYNTNLFDIDRLYELEYKQIRLVYDDKNRSYLYNPNGVLLTSVPIKKIEYDDKSYNNMYEKGVGRQVTTERVRKEYTKVIFDDGKFITLYNAGSNLQKKLEQLIN